MTCPIKRLRILVDAARDEIEDTDGRLRLHPGAHAKGGGGCGGGRFGDLPPAWGVTSSYCPGKGEVRLWKVLQTNACELNCHYCAFAKSRNTRRASFTPDEMAARFMELHDVRRVEGLFLSSGILGGPDRSMERIVATAEILRQRYRFRGYIHLKVMPGSCYSAIEEAARYTNRLSLNLEGASSEHLQRLAPEKQYDSQMLQGVARISEAMARAGHRIDQVTQFVVGPAGESDRDVLGAAAWLYRCFHVRRAYYSGFRQVTDSPFQERPETSPARQHRLYQADWLLRYYGYRAEELPFDETGRLPLDVDPKTAYAMKHPELFPIEINTACREELLRVPGLGDGSVRRVLASRREGRIRDLEALGLPDATTRRAAAYVLCDGRLHKQLVIPISDHRARSESLPRQGSFFELLEEHHGSHRRHTA